MPKSQRSKTCCGLMVGSLMLSAVSGCASDDSQATAPPIAVLAAVADAGSANAAQILRDPHGRYVAEVTTNGTGCYPGSAKVWLAPDGVTFTGDYSVFEVTVDEAQRVGVKDCQFRMKLHSTRGVSFGVKSIGSRGYAFLDRGASGRYSESFQFAGGLRKELPTQKLVGPYDDVFRMQYDAGDEENDSPCSTESELWLAMRLAVNNANPPSTSYMNFTSLDGSRKFGLVLSVKECELSEEPGRDVD